MKKINRDIQKVCYFNLITVLSVLIYLILWCIVFFFCIKQPILLICVTILAFPATSALTFSLFKYKHKLEDTVKTQLCNLICKEIQLAFLEEGSTSCLFKAKALLITDYTCLFEVEIPISADENIIRNIVAKVQANINSNLYPKFTIGINIRQVRENDLSLVV